MIQIGEYTVPTGPDEEIKARPTLMERLSRWLIRDPLIDAERELLLQQARRLKLKTDLQEQRLANKAERAKLLEERAKQHKTVATVEYSLRYQKKPIVALLAISESKKEVRCQIVSVRFEDSGQMLSNANSAVFDYIRKTSWYTTIILPWIQGSINLKELRERSKTDTAVWTWIK